MGVVFWTNLIEWYRVTLSHCLQVKVIFGDDRERIGTLINIDDPDGIIKMEQTEQLKILPLKFLAKIGQTVWAQINNHYVHCTPLYCEMEFKMWNGVYI